MYLFAFLLFVWIVLNYSGFYLYLFLFTIGVLLYYLFQSLDEVGKFMKENNVSSEDIEKYLTDVLHTNYKDYIENNIEKLYDEIYRDVRYGNMKIRHTNKFSRVENVKIKLVREYLDYRRRNNN